jgi:dissimilatory sulfite reductase (desulfoviridin) alpha/beta subunit
VEAVCPIKTAQVVDGKLVCTDCNNCGRCVGKCPFGVTDCFEDGYKVYIGGRWGKKVAQGQPLERLFTSEEAVLSLVEKCILLFREQGIAGERFADTVARLGFENVQAQLLSDDILARKDEILK